MRRVTRDCYSYVFDRRLEPVLRVEPGETFEVETQDARTGRTRTPGTTSAGYVKGLRTGGPYYGNPVTGPVFVAGAEPGDALAVRVHAIACDSPGFCGYWPFVYHLQDWFQEPVTELVEVRDGAVHYTLQTATGPHPLRIPLRPMAGCIGTAPHLEVPTAGTAGRFGGNLDAPEVCPGSTVYLPVAAPGGLLYVGDCHPYQGDGEVSGCEVQAVVTLSIEVRKNGAAGALTCPRVETAEYLVTVGIGSPAETAQWQAVREMILWLEERYGWTKADARLFLTLVGDLRPGQVQVAPYTMRLLVRKGDLPTLSA